MKKFSFSDKESSSVHPNRISRILITGGCGFIGVNLVIHLIKHGFSYIRILDNLSIVKKDNLEEALKEIGGIRTVTKKSQFIYKIKNKTNINNRDKCTIDLIVGDIRSQEICQKAMKNIDSVIHLAAHAGVIPSIKDPFYDFEVNAKGSLNLLYEAVKNKVDKFIFASSNAPLGEQNPPMHEEKVPKPLSPYGASKLACEAYCLAFYGSYSLKTVILRFSNVYGPYCFHKNSVIAQFIKDGFIKKTLTIYGDGSQTRDFLYVEDLCQAISLILNVESSLKSSDIWGEIFHIGTGKETPIAQIANSIKSLFSNDIKIIFEQGIKGEIKKNYSDISKAGKLLGYKVEIPLQLGLKETFRWFKIKFERRES